MLVGDGGILENLGLLPMLQRRVERVVCFMANGPIPTAEAWDPDARAVSRIKRIRASLGRLGSRLRSSFRILRSPSSPRSDDEADLQGIEVKFPQTVASPRLPAQ